MNNTSVAMADEVGYGKVLWPSVLLFIYILLPEILAVGFETFLFLCFLLFVAIWWIASREKFPADIPHFIGPLGLILFVGLLGVEGHEGYDVAKDVWYVTNAALSMIVGYVLMLNMRDLSRFFRVFVIASTIIAIFYLRPFVMYPWLLDLNFSVLRKLSGGGPMAPCVALGVLLAARMGGIRLFEKSTCLFYLAVALCSAAVILTYSRTELVMVSLFALTVFGWVQFTSRRRVVLLIAGMASLVVIGMSLPVAQEIGWNATLIDKALYSLQEMRVMNYVSLASINEHWRGYETLRALYTYSLGTPLQYLIGGGFGTNVDLGFFINLGGERMRFAPILHNGYMYLLVKTGMVGLFFYLLLLYRVTRRGTLLSFSQRMDVKYCGRLIVGLSLSFVATTFVIAGMFNKSGMLTASLLLGALLAYGSISEKEAAWKRV
ncbi:MAG: O-antigen ligase family protein [Burkholderiales bacterium]|nr:O-antigen ligase family protein [Burkholderiales bacterium]